MAQNESALCYLIFQLRYPSAFFYAIIYYWYLREGPSDHIFISVHKCCLLYTW